MHRQPIRSVRHDAGAIAKERDNPAGGPRGGLVLLKTLDRPSMACICRGMWGWRWPHMQLSVLALEQIPKSWGTSMRPVL